MDIPLRGEDVGHCSLRRYALDKVCSCLASAYPDVRAALFSRLCGSGPPAPSHPYSSSGGAATTSPAAATAPALAAVPPPGDEGSVGIPSSIGDSIITRTGEMGRQTSSGILDLLCWCTPRVLDLEGVSPAVTDSLLLRYPGESCAMLEEVRLGWCPHLLEVEALLLKIRNAGVDGQEDEACALRVLDVSGSEGISDGILKVKRVLLGGAVTVGCSEHVHTVNLKNIERRAAEVASGLLLQLWVLIWIDSSHLPAVHLMPPKKESCITSSLTEGEVISRLEDVQSYR
ncbi:unnamed protein product [Ectocarpus sp. CCAP 1310/34]|nr:unnamed protein product [Ectocarpus sp. CCAP 1310/34]